MSPLRRILTDRRWSVRRKGAWLWILYRLLGILQLLWVLGRLLDSDLLSQGLLLRLHLLKHCLLGSKGGLLDMGALPLAAADETVRDHEHPKQPEDDRVPDQQERPHDQ